MIDFERKLKLAIFVVGTDSVIENFITYKKEVAKYLGVEFLENRFKGDEENLENLIIEKIKEVSLRVDGIVVQLPLPKNLNMNKILQAIPMNLDVDVLSGKEQDKDILAPVTGAVWEILQRNNINTTQKKVLIVGNGKLVGQPTYEFLKNKCKEITVITSQTKNKEKLYKNADVIISGVGIPNLIKPEMIQEGVVLIDAGTSTINKELVGDIDLTCEPKASIFSKTPNGVGPITIAVLYKNLVELYKKN